MYDKIRVSVRNLSDLGVQTNTYGSLLISIIFDRIPEELKIIISRKFKDQNWDLDSLIATFQEELYARERCDALSSENKNKDEKGFESEDPTQRPYTFFVNTNTKVCVFCGHGDHIPSRCLKITDVNMRKQLLRKTGRCFVCLNKGHISRKCKVNYSCVKCKQRHNVSICTDKPQASTGYERNSRNNNRFNDERVSENHSLLINSPNNNNNVILLQTALSKVYNTEENVSRDARLLFDGGSQRTYITEELKNSLNLHPIRTETIVMKRFASDEGVLKTLDVVQLCVRGKIKNVNVYIEALCVPFLCSPLRDQDVMYAKKNILIYEI